VISLEIAYMAVRIANTVLDVTGTVQKDAVFAMMP
jgi:hypothetical protein